MTERNRRSAFLLPMRRQKKRLAKKNALLAPMMPGWYDTIRAGIGAMQVSRKSKVLSQKSTIMIHLIFRCYDKKEK